MSDIAQLMVRVGTDTAGAEAGLGRVGAMLGPSAPIALGAAAIGAAVLGIGVASVKMAGDFQQGMTTLVTGAGESEGNLKLVSDGILKMATDTGTSTKQLTDGMYMIESAGYHGADGLKVLQAAAEGAKVGNADLGTVADATTTIMRDYPGVMNGATGAVNALVATVASGKTHMEDLSGSLSQVLPTAAAARVGLNDVMGAMATMTAEGVPAANAATYLRQMIIALDAPGGKAKKTLEEIGLSSSQVAQEMQKSLPDALKDITDHLKRKFPEGSAAYVEALKDIAGGSKQMQGMLDLTGEHLDAFSANVSGVAGAVQQGGDKVQGWALVQKDFNFQLDKAKEVAETLFIKLGTGLLPILTDLMQAVAPLATALGDTLVSAMQGLSGSIGSDILPDLQQLASWFSAKVLPVLGDVATIVMQDLVPALQGVWTQVQHQLIPALQNLWDKIEPALIPAFKILGAYWKDVLGPAIGVLVNWLSFLVTGIGDVIGVVITVVSHVAAFATSVWNLTQPIRELISAGLKPLWEQFKAGLDVLGQVKDWLAVQLAPVWKATTLGIGLVATGASEMAGAVGDAVGKAIEFFRSLLHQALEVAASIPGPWQESAKAMLKTLDDQEREAKEKQDLMAADAKAAANAAKAAAIDAQIQQKQQTLATMQDQRTQLKAQYDGTTDDATRAALQQRMNVLDQDIQLEQGSIASAQRMRAGIVGAFTDADKQAMGALDGLRQHALTKWQQMEDDAANVKLGPTFTAGTQDYNGGRGVQHFASGGVIPEEVVGYGKRSGQLYAFGEDGPEMVVPNGQLPNLYARGGGAPLSDTSGGGSGGSGGGAPAAQTIIIQLDGRVIAQSTVKHLPSVIRVATGTRGM